MLFLQLYKWLPQSIYIYARPTFFNCIVFYMTKEHTLPWCLSIIKRRSVFMPFPMALLQNKYKLCLSIPVFALINFLPFYTSILVYWSYIIFTWGLNNSFFLLSVSFFSPLLLIILSLQKSRKKSGRFIIINYFQYHFIILYQSLILHFKIIFKLLTNELWTLNCLISTLSFLINIFQVRNRPSVAYNTNSFFPKSVCDSIKNKNNLL